MRSRGLRTILRAGFLCLSVFFAPTLLLAQEQDDLRGAPAEPTDTAEIRAQMAIAENLCSGKIPDRGAILYFLAVSHALLRETLPAIYNCNNCALKEGFDPSGDSAFAVLRTSSDFGKVVEQVRKDFRQ